MGDVVMDTMDHKKREKGKEDETQQGKGKEIPKDVSTEDMYGPSKSRRKERESHLARSPS